jgi:hypothetical protein
LLHFLSILPAIPCTVNANFCRACFRAVKWTVIPDISTIFLLALTRAKHNVKLVSMSALEISPLEAEAFTAPAADLDTPENLENCQGPDGAFFYEESKLFHAEHTGLIKYGDNSDGWHSGMQIVSERNVPGTDIRDRYVNLEVTRGLYGFDTYRWQMVVAKELPIDANRPAYTRQERVASQITAVIGKSEFRQAELVDREWKDTGAESPDEMMEFITAILKSPVFKNHIRNIHALRRVGHERWMRAFHDNTMLFSGNTTNSTHLVKIGDDERLKIIKAFHSQANAGFPSTAMIDFEAIKT